MLLKAYINLCKLKGFKAELLLKLILKIKINISKTITVCH